MCFNSHLYHKLYHKYFDISDPYQVTFIECNISPVRSDTALPSREWNTNGVVLLVKKVQQ